MTQFTIQVTLLFFHRHTNLLSCLAHLLTELLPRFVTTTMYSSCLSQLTQGQPFFGMVVKFVGALTNCLLCVYSANYSNII